MVEGSTRGRPTSWAAVAIIIFGFILGGAGMIAGSVWVFGAGLAVALAGGVFGLAVGIMKDVH